MAITGTLSTTGAVDSAVISVSVDAAAATDVGTIEPQDFVHEGRDK